MDDTNLRKKPPLCETRRLYTTFRCTWEKRIQSVVGLFLYYGRAIDNTILPALNEIALSQAEPTEMTNKKVNMLLNYLHTYKNAIIRFH